jgi:hypothetical protein
LVSGSPIGAEAGPFDEGLVELLGFVAEVVPPDGLVEARAATTCPPVDLGLASRPGWVAVVATDTTVTSIADTTATIPPTT